ncbi:putative alcohol dehydrogenase [Trichoderma barbatum]
MAVRRATQSAIKVRGTGIVELVIDDPVPSPRAAEVLVQVISVGINPHDWKVLDMSPSVGSTWGCDFAGKVVAVGSDMTSDFRPGDHVCGASEGAFAEFMIVPEGLVYRMPSSMAFEEGATLGVGLLTIGLSLYHFLKVPLPFSTQPHPGQYVLVYGGGTATGSLAIQALKHSGMKPITTCSPGNFARVKSLGAVAAWDYHSPSCGADIREFTENELTLVLDCITDSESMKICYTAIGSQGGKYVGLDQFPIRGHTRQDIRPDWIICFTMMGEPIHWKKPYNRDAKPKHKAFYDQTWRPIAQKLLDESMISAHPTEICDGGLAAVSDGVDRVRKGLAEGKKLVYRISSP